MIITTIYKMPYNESNYSVLYYIKDTNEAYRTTDSPSREHSL